MKKFICFALVLSAIFQNVVITDAASTVPLDLNSPSAILLDEYGNVIFEKNAHDQREPASVTKIMTMLLTMEAIDKGQINEDCIVTASAEAASQGGTQIYLAEGEQITVHELLKSIAVNSANDAAYALGEYVGGSKDEFVSMMNQRAQELGMEDTTFKNPSGLHDDGHVTSAYDIALMSVELLKHEKIYDYTTIWTDSIRDGAFELANTNKLLNLYEGIVGLKTGYTSDAMYCISSVATRDDQTFIAVCMGADSSDERNNDVMKMLDYAFDNYEHTSLFYSQSVEDIAVTEGEAEFVSLEVVNTENLFLFEIGAQVITSVDVLESLEAPVLAGQKVGTVTFKKSGEVIHQCDIVTTEEVPVKSFKTTFLEFLKVFFMQR